MELNRVCENLGMSFPMKHQAQDAIKAAPPVLVVDDSRAHRRLLARSLAKWGYETIEADSGEAALDICRNTSIDIIISDWMMPGGMTGVEFCKALREIEERRAYFILLTAQTEREVLAEGLESGADDFLSKPFNSVELRARIRAGERLIKAQNDLAEQNATLEDAYAAIDRDLRGARVFQEGLVPNRSLKLEQFDVSLLFQSSGHVGGDLVGYFRVNQHEIGVYSVDVSGHGVASALMTARIAGFFSDVSPERNISLTRVGESYGMIPLEDACTRLNTLLQEDSDSDQYLTMALARVNLNTGQVEVCSAGHPSPAIQRADGRVEMLEMWSTPIGLLDDVEFEKTDIQLAPGDRLLLYSDGLTECPDPNGNLLDDDGLSELLIKCADKNGLDLVSSVADALVDFHGGSDFPDDLSAALIQRI
ncbi:MAG: fused response regulator/phosphatase [Pseudomonadota bacterium]